MNSENMKNNDPIQLQQMIIFLKSEVTKYKKQVDLNKNRDHYSLIDKLEQENKQLTNELDELSQELDVLKDEFGKQANNNRDRLKQHEIEIEKKENLIDTLQVKNAELWMMNKQLVETVNKIIYGMITNQRGSRKQDRQVSALHSKLADYRTTIEQLEKRLLDFIQITGKDIHAKIESLDRNDQENSQLGIVKHHVLHARLKKTPTLVKQVNSDSSNIPHENLEVLERRINNMITQSTDYEEDLEAKLLLLNELEQKLDQLALQVNEGDLPSGEPDLVEET